MKILIVLIAGIGDLILASKSIRAIRNGHPDSEIHLITSAEAAPVARQYNYLDRVFEFPIRKIRENKFVVFHMFKIILQLRKVQYNTIINLYQIASFSGAFQMGILFSMLRAPVKIGHDNKGFGCFINKKINANNYKNRHFTDAFMNVALHSGGKPDKKSIDVFYPSSSEKKWHHLFEKKLLKNHTPIIAINPGSDQPNKRLHPDRLVAIAESLFEQYNAHIIILGGPNEKNISQHIQKTMKNKAINLAGKLTINDLTYIISKLDLLITNDSAPMHIAAAQNIRQVAIFGPGYPKLFGPYTSTENYTLIYKQLDCRPCMNKKCDHISCLNNITVKEVVEAACELLKNSNQHMV